MKSYGSPNIPGRCYWCGEKLPLSFGIRGHVITKDQFCTLTCGAMFASRMVTLGRFFDPVEPPKKIVTRYVYPKCPDCGGKMGLGTNGRYGNILLCRGMGRLGYDCDLRLDHTESKELPPRTTPGGNRVIEYVIKQEPTT